MHIHEVLQFVDEAVYLKTGKRLNDLQRGIIEGTLKRQKYCDIAETYGCTAGHAKDEGYKLLQLLSNIFGETVDKNNLKSVLERQINLSINLGYINNNFVNSKEVNYINICPENPNPISDKNKPVTDQLKNRRNKVNKELISKLQQFGLSNEQIADALNLSLDTLNQANLDNSK